MREILNKQERAEIRKRIFLHLDGWALLPSIYALYKLNSVYGGVLNAMNRY